MQAGFGTKLAWIADRAQEVVFVGRDDEDGIRAARLAAAVGITNVGGYLDGGMTSWREEQRETGRIERVDVPGLRELTRADSGRAGPGRARAGGMGRAATSPARSSRPTTTSTRSRTGSIPRARSR